MSIDPALLQRANAWLQEPFDEATQLEVRRMINSDPKSLSDAFFKELSFGTGGLRGLMGPGTNRLNIYTIRAATLGLARVLLKQSTNPSVFIGYDVRHHSKEFAEEATRVLTANGIRVYLTKEICPTPLVSFGCRFYRCSAAIMITASHNPSNYNGYKVYWSDGGQVVAPYDQEIIDEVRKIAIDQPIALSPLDSPLIQWVGDKLDEAYLAALKSLQLHHASPIKILYTPLHGTGIRILPSALNSWGYSDLHLVEEQKKPDADFTHASSLNPEEEKALKLGQEKQLQIKADLLIATDPDADRIGIAVLHQGKSVILTGNQIACLCLHHICTTLHSREKFPSNAAFIKTIVTTELFRKIAEKFGGLCVDVLTGFKYIGQQITLWQDTHQYLFGAEESHGYLFGTLVRDKDAINSSCLIVEMAALAKKQNLTLIDCLHQIYQTFGLHRESLTTLSLEESAICALMQRLRNAPPTSIADVPVEKFQDHQKASSLPKSDVLRFWLSDGSKLVIRPSGTEPKLKIYGEIVQENSQDIQLGDARLKALIEGFLKENINSL